MKTLIVEDDLTSRRIMKKFLSPYGRCDTAVDGKEGIQCFNLAMEKNEPYDLICLDIMMPDVDGKRALEEIRRMEKKVGIKESAESKVIMLSALGDPKTVMGCLGKGATAYLVKPIAHEKLLEHLRTFELI